MLVEPPARGVRVGGVTVAPGEARQVEIILSARPARTTRTAAARSGATNGAPAAPAPPRSIPAWVVVGLKPGPRVSVVGAQRGHETTAALAAARLAAGLDPAALMGSVVIVPVLRPAGKLSRTGRPRRAWHFPGDAAGKRVARDAFALFSDVVVGASALVVLGVPRRGRRGAVVAQGRLTDPRVRRLARGSGATVMVAARSKAGGLLAAAAAAQIPGVELSASGDTRAADSLARAARAVIAAAGVLGRAGEGVLPADLGADEPMVASRAMRIRAPIDGFLETDVAPGDSVRARATLGRVVPSLPGPPAVVATRVDGLVVEAAGAGPVRAGTTLFVLVPLARAAARRLDNGRADPAPPGARSDGKVRVGWVEYVALPSLEIERLKAKIDTGARTSALHVARMRTVDTTGGPHRRPILEITVPSGGRGRLPHRVRAAVHGFVMVRDTSGRTERRPVIETTLRLGALKRRIAVTLTNRGDMLFPVLIGRTALGPGIVVDPSRRYLHGKAKDGAKPGSE
ncbi:MAG TPA: RimK/LysX family protein [Polyangia bacterium]|nr:RimK/LysX family protein [Polyangia bacterium]